MINSLIFAGSLLTTPVQMQPQTFYVANLSEDDGAKCGSYYEVFPQTQFTQQFQPMGTMGAIAPLQDDNDPAIVDKE